MKKNLTLIILSVCMPLYGFTQSNESITTKGEDILYKGTQYQTEILSQHYGTALAATIIHVMDAQRKTIAELHFYSEPKNYQKNARQAEEKKLIIDYPAEMYEQVKDVLNHSRGQVEFLYSPKLSTAKIIAAPSIIGAGGRGTQGVIPDMSPIRNGVPVSKGEMLKSNQKTGPTNSPQIKKP